VLNINGKTAYTQSTNKIHKQQCGHLNKERNEGKMTKPGHAKYCSNDLNELKRKGDSLETEWEFCASCMKDFKAGLSK